MKALTLRITLLSDTIFGTSSGVSTFVDIDIQTDDYGCPYLGARAIKGLLRDECAQILFSLEQIGQLDAWLPSAFRLFGKPGDAVNDESLLHIQNAVISKELHDAIRYQVEDMPIRGTKISKDEILTAFTDIRYQTAINHETGTAKDKSLRSKRVILRNQYYEAPVLYNGDNEQDLALLAACVKALRKAGTDRNRGSGEIHVELRGENGSNLTDHYCKILENKLQPEGSKV